MSKRQEIRERRRRQQIRNRILMVLLLTAGVLLVSFAFIYPAIQEATNQPDIVTITPRGFDAPVELNTIGDPNAPIRVDVWEDFQCSACVTYSENVEKLIIENYVETGIVFYTYHFFPFMDDSDPTSHESDQAANAAMCAAEQGRFWDYHDILYGNWRGVNQGGFSDSRLEAFAEALDLNMGDFENCFGEKRYSAMIQQDIADGETIGVRGTPSVFVNGVHVTPGYVPSYDEMVRAIETALAGE
ncbi:MAG: thioredoxin domain-containing protein [Chloroflexota bacterium]